MGLFTDLACEKCTDKLAKHNDKLKYGCKEVVVNINSTRKQQKYGLNRGNYYFLECPNLNLLSPIVSDYMITLVASYLKTTIGKKINFNKPNTILVVGLGNQNLVCDSLGARVTSKLIVGQAVECGHKILSFCPNVFGQTGIDSARLIKSVTASVRPDLVILVDSLCALSTARLGVSIQICDLGLIAGGGGGEGKTLIDSKYLGVKTITIGVPLVVKTETIVSDVLKTLSEQSELHNQSIIKNINNFLVTPKDIDSLVRLNAEIIASSINLAVLGVDIEMQKAVLK